MKKKAPCQICHKDLGAYSPTRRIHICVTCWFWLGRQESRFNSDMAQDLTGQDAERDMNQEVA